MILVWQFLAVLMVTVVNCQSHVWFNIQERALLNNSYIYYANIGNGYNALKCVTDNPNCCTDSYDGNWNDETGTVVHEGRDNTSCLYVTRGNGEIYGGSLGPSTTISMLPLPSTFHFHPPSTSIKPISTCALRMRKGMQAQLKCMLAVSG